mmetsp:Transcript_25140/g.63760  ORF Transcript_25140/g.63760 Transcript_25140/m.63760 type:complete len:546 (+) Transcript_25140:1336-2973(+)
MLCRARAVLRALIADAEAPLEVVAEAEDVPGLVHHDLLEGLADDGLPLFPRHVRRQQRRGRAVEEAALRLLGLLRLGPFAQEAQQWSVNLLRTDFPARQPPRRGRVAARRRGRAALLEPEAMPRRGRRARGGFARVQVRQVIQVRTDPAVGHDDVALHDLSAARVHLRDAHAEDRGVVNAPGHGAVASIVRIVVRGPVCVRGQHAAHRVRQPDQREGLVPGLDALLEDLAPAERHRRVDVDADLVVWLSSEVVAPDHVHLSVRVGVLHVVRVEVHAKVRVARGEVVQAIVVCPGLHRHVRELQHRERDRPVPILHAHIADRHIEVQCERGGAGDAVGRHSRNMGLGNKEAVRDQDHAIHDDPVRADAGAGKYLQRADPRAVRALIQRIQRLHVRGPHGGHGLEHVHTHAIGRHVELVERVGGVLQRVAQRHCLPKAIYIRAPGGGGGDQHRRLGRQEVGDVNEQVHGIRGGRIQAHQAGVVRVHTQVNGHHGRLPRLALRAATGRGRRVTCALDARPLAAGDGLHGALRRLERRVVDGARAGGGL